MLSLHRHENYLFTGQNIRDEIGVTRPTIKLMPVAYVMEESEGPRFRGRSAASLYFTPDQQAIIRLPSSWCKNRFFDYEEATQIPSTHPVWEILKNQKQHSGEVIQIPESKEDDIGEPADPKLIKWFKEILDQQLQKETAEYRRAQGLEL